MKISFNIEYKTNFGEELLLNVVANKPGDKPAVLRMQTIDGHTWTTQLSLSDDYLPQRIDYFYSLNNGRTQQRHEWQTVTHRLELSVKGATAYTTHDRWYDMPEDSYLYSSAFTGCVNRHPREQVAATDFAQTLRLIVRAPQLRCGERLMVVGDDKALGNWDTKQAIAMTEHNYNEWQADIDAATIAITKVELKFIAIDDKGAILWETGGNRTVGIPKLKAGEVWTSEQDQAFFEICNAKLAGTLIPLFSLRSASSFGVGDFGDLKKMIDWVANTNQRVLQLLPINDTTSTHTWTDSYPYSCISIFALHPQYADLNQLPPIADKDLREKYEALRLKLNALKQIDYEQVNDAKTQILRIAYEQEGSKALRSDAFKTFFAANEHWLVPYAQYCHLRDKYSTALFEQWPDHNQWSEKDRTALSNPRTKAFKEVAFHYYVQYVLDRQMSACHEYAVARGVVLKGDIPIGVSRHGCDVWHEPEYFHLDSQAGAPPDAFAVNGQNWGFPTYNWEKMIEDGCQWWIRRFQNMAKYFDAYRIDHVLGFFRIWAIPGDCVHALTGQFSPSQAMTRDEIEVYGLKFQEEFFTRPFIARWIVEEVFGERAGEVIEKYLDCAHDDIYDLKPEFDTQRKIEAAFSGRISEADANLRDGLYSLLTNVLFVRDHDNPNKFHPRITAQMAYTYRVLPQQEKDSFNALYDDYFYRRNNYFWYRESMKKLPMLVQATRMLVCAEDLGMVPDCVAWTMQQLRILSLELQQMPKDPKVRFGYLSRNPYRSVCTFSTHDMATLRQWWDEDEERTQAYYSTMLYRGGTAPHPLPGWLARDIISRQLACPSMLCVLSLQDWFAMDEKLRLPDAGAERINIPANPRHYWRYRMHVNIEDLLANKDYNDQVKELIAENGR